MILRRTEPYEPLCERCLKLHKITLAEVAFELADKRSDGRVGKFNRPEQFRAGRAGRVEIAACGDVLFDQLLSDAHRLKVHAEYRWNANVLATIMRESMNLIQHGLHFEIVVFCGAHHAMGVVIAGGVGDLGSVQVVNTLA